MLARCFQLQDAVAVLELDGVLDWSPEELEESIASPSVSPDEFLELIAREAPSA